MKTTLDTILNDITPMEAAAALLLAQSVLAATSPNASKCLARLRLGIVAAAGGLKEDSRLTEKVTNEEALP